MSVSGEQDQVHVALLPSSSMGHLNPFLRLAVSLMKHNVQVTIITAYPTVSPAEAETLSRFFSSYPKLIQKQLHLLPVDSSTTEYKDPFHVQYEVIRRSSHLLLPILTSASPSLSALITDMSLASSVIPVTQSISLPNYIFFTTSATMLMVFLSYSITDGSITSRGGAYSDGKTEVFEIPGVQPIPISWLPPTLLAKENILIKTHMIEIGKAMIGSSGILTNTCEALEQESLAALNGGRVVKGLPPVTAIGPLAPCDSEKGQVFEWLDCQPGGSVVYVCFGSRITMSGHQLKELADGLLRSECRFLWVVKEKKIDQENEKELDQLVGQEFMQNVQAKGLVVKNWVNQVDILAHPAVGGFISHCGWNSVTEALWYGKPILAWPQNADQKINASVLKRIGLGLWEESWEWGGGEVVLKGPEIGEKVKEMMTNEILKEKAAEIGVGARAAVEDEQRSDNKILRFIEMCRNSDLH